MIHAAGGSSGGARQLANEPLGVALVGGVEHHGPGGVQLLGVALVDDGWGHHPDPGVAVFVAVPVEELAAVSAGALDVVEPGGELRPVLQVLKFDSE